MSHYPNVQFSLSSVYSDASNSFYEDHLIIPDAESSDDESDTFGERFSYKLKYYLYYGYNYFRETSILENDKTLDSLTEESLGNG